jgi:serine protease Do
MMRRIITILIMIFLLFIVIHSEANAQVDVKKIVKSVSPSIVKVVSENHKKYVATGIAIAPDYIVSTIMITKYPYNNIYIETVNRETYDAKLVGKDSGASLLLLKIDKKVLTPIKTAKTYEVGDWTALVGVFYNKFPSIYQGIVSSFSDDELILNAPVAPGSSGGAVVNNKGELMGVIRGRFGYTVRPDYTYRDQTFEFFIQSSRNRNKDLCYAVPISKVKSITTDLREIGRVRRGYLGVTLIASLSPKDVGLIESVSLNSPAHKAGILKNDMIIKIKDTPVKNAGEAAKIIKSLKPGQKVKIDLLRNKEKKQVVVVIGEAKDHRLAWSLFTSPRQRIIPELPYSLPSHYNIVIPPYSTKSLGVDTVTLTPELARKFAVKEASGIMISKVHMNTAAAKAGFQTADIIVKAGDIEVKKISDLRTVLKGLKDNEPVTMKIYRQGILKTIDVIPDTTSNVIPGIVDKVRQKINEVNVRIDDEKILDDELRKKYMREFELFKETQIKKYKSEIEKMRKEQEQLRDKINRLLKLYKELEEKKKKEDTI